MPNLRLTINKTIASREELDSYVRTTFGENADNNRGIVIEAHPDTLKALSLSEDTVVFGVKFAASDELEAPEAES